MKGSKSLNLLTYNSFTKSLYELNNAFEVVLGGERLPRKGLFFPPTILAEVDDDNFAAIEESFGPIMCVSRFDDEWVHCPFLDDFKI